MLAKPRRERLRLPVGEQVDGPVGVHVHQHGAVHMAAAQREVVDTKRRHAADLGFGQRP
jgi:hypothetical protein